MKRIKKKIFQADDPITNDIDLANLEVMGQELADLAKQLGGAADGLKFNSDQLEHLKRETAYSLTISYSGKDFVVHDEGNIEAIHDVMIKEWTSRVRSAYEKTAEHIKEILNIIE